MSLTSSVALVAALFTSACDKGPATTPAPKVTPSTVVPTGAAPIPAATTLALPTLAQPPGKAFGTGITMADTVAIDEILANPAAYNGKAVRVEGLVTDVCPKRGCWFELAGKSPGKKLRFKVQDGVMVFPMEAKGQTAIAQGVVTVQQLTLEQSQAYAKDQAEEYGTPYDPASITTPTSIVRIDGTGAVLREPT